MIRSAAAVLAGLGVFTVALAGMNMLIGPVDAFQTPGMVLWVAWQAIAMAAAGFTVASIARRAPHAHAMIMAGLQSLFTLTAFFTIREASSPAWFWLSAIVMMAPAAWLGARIRGRLQSTGQLASTTPARSEGA